MIHNVYRHRRNHTLVIKSALTLSLPRKHHAMIVLYTRLSRRYGAFLDSGIYVPWSASAKTPGSRIANNITIIVEQLLHKTNLHSRQSFYPITK